MNTEELCEQLQSADRHSKIAALEELQRHCETDPPKLLITTFDECYLHLLKCYSDRYESVRDAAVKTVTQFAERLPPNDFHLLNIIATLVERMGQQETVEESEEIRLLYVVQVHTLVRHYVATGSGRALHESCGEMVRVLVKALRDPYAAVQREACACVSAAARAADTFAFQQWAEPLAKALYGMLNHKHSQARIAAVEALGRVALHIDARGEALSRLVMEVSPLLMDSMPLVRRECGQLGVLLLLELRDRYSYFERLIPLVLCCLKDDSPEVSDYIRPFWVQCGKLYYDENEAELNKKEIADLQPENYPLGVQRPTIGCRALVQRSLRLLGLITREAADWKENVRRHSLKLLYQFVLHAEAAMTAKFFEIYPDVARACQDPEAIVVNEALKVADLMGRLLCYDDWREHGFIGLEKNAKEGYLKCFYFMFTAAADNSATREDVVRISKMLVRSEFSQTLRPEIKMYVIKLVETLLIKTENQQICEKNPIEASLKQLNLNTSDVKQEEEDGKVEEKPNYAAVLYRNMYVSTIKVMALSLDTAEQRNADELHLKGNAILDEIARRQCITTAALHERYFAEALADVENLDAPLDALSEPILLLNGLLSLAKYRASYLAPLQAKLQVVWQHCADEAKVKIFSGVSIAMLQWSETLAAGVEASAQLLRQFVAAVVEPHLVWQAGANAEAMRSMAMATLCSMSQGAAEEARLVLPGAVAKYMPSLLEDHAIATRHYAVKCLFNFGALPVEELKAIAYATLQRLDDPSAGIRELAATAIPKLCPKFEQEKGAPGAYEHEIWETFIQKAVDMMFLHYEGPEVRLKAAIKNSLLQLAALYPEICQMSLLRTLAMSYNNNESLLALQQELAFET